MLTLQGLSIRERLVNLTMEFELPLSTITQELEWLDKEETALIQLSAKCKAINSDEDKSFTGRKKAVDAAIQEQIKRLAGHESKIAAFDRFIKDVDAEIVNILSRAKGRTIVRDLTETMLYELRLQEIRRLLIEKQKDAREELDARIARAKKFELPLSDEERTLQNVALSHALAAAQSYNADTDRAKLMLVAVEDSPVAMITADEQAQVDQTLAGQVAQPRLEAQKAARLRKAATELILSQLEKLSRQPELVVEARQQDQPPLSDQQRALLAAGVPLEPVKPLEV
ncbi:hypothetical protein Despr_2684 [Desulfobulbus propionicus DSM 2032]|uniref:Uncharacterized protein n=2 Tax=Desulfobulbus propionicus TaxID=894 RepID=A0A7U3YNV3_DESPD|nr:hypothetical protein Despr_2684 [Desulfobulbus propionicus DSM 2032]